MVDGLPEGRDTRETPPTSDVDALRAKLRDLGYLDAGVDRFVLAPARGDRSVAGIAFGASVRAGLLAGLLFGLSGTIAVATRLPGLVTGFADALVLAAYLGLLGALAIALTTFAITMIADRVARAASGLPGFERRAQRAARLAGLLVSAAGLLYLTLWWRALGPTTGARTFAASALALTVAAAISLLLGRTTAITALALLARENRDLSVGRFVRRSWRATVLTVAACIALAGVLLLATGRGTPPAPPIERPVVVPTGLRLLVIAIDGFDQQFFAERVAASRDVGTLTRLLQGGRASLTVTDDSDPARLWTTIATGQPPERHGIAGLETRRVAGLEGRLPGGTSGPGRLLAATTDVLRLTRPVVSAGDVRRERTFWEVAAGAGLRTVAVNWWASWPARSGDGVVITDRAALRLARGGALAGEIAPAPVYEGLRSAWPELERRAMARRHDAGFSSDATGGEAAALVQAADVDAMPTELALATDGPTLDLVTVYLPGLDVLQTRLLAGESDSATDVARRIEALERYYEYLDKNVAALAAATDRSVVLIAAPGRSRGRLGGTIALGLNDAGPAAAAGNTAASPLDVAPTILYALGLPLAADLPGRPRLELFDRAFVDRFAPRTIARYGPRDRAEGGETANAPGLDEEMRERLRSLGYVR